MYITFTTKNKNKIKHAFRKICIHRVFKICIKLDFFHCAFVDLGNKKVVSSIRIRKPHGRCKSQAGG